MVFPIVYPQSEQDRTDRDVEIQPFSLVNIWGPFAGWGERSRHLGWVLDGQGDRASELIQKIWQKFQERHIPNTQLSSQILMARGVLVDMRPYFVLQRRQIRLALRVSKEGRDLFVSLVSYLKPPISNFRVLVFMLMVGFWLFSTIVLPLILVDAVENSGLRLLGGLDGSAFKSYLTLLFCIFPLSLLNNLALFLFVVYGFYKWLIDKDFFAGLRSKPNEFNLDDMMMMEKAVEQTVRVSMDEIGLNSNDLKATFASSGGRLI